MSERFVNICSGTAQIRVIYLDVLLEILRTLERLATELALVRLERDVDANVRGDVIALNSSSAARVPLASEVQVVGALAADMALTDVLLSSRVSIGNSRKSHDGIEPT